MYQSETQIKEAQRNGDPLQQIFENLLKSENLLKKHHSNPFKILEYGGYQLQKKDYIDMTGAWEKLHPDTQKEYSTEYQKWYAKQLGVNVEQNFPCATTSLKMRLIPPGLYWKGSPSDEMMRQVNEDQEEVLLSKPFWCGVYTVTQQQWQSVVGENSSYFEGENRPVECITRQNCNIFCEKTSFKLLTEREWEYACRAGTTTPFWFGEQISSSEVNYVGRPFSHYFEEAELYRRETVEVGSLPPNSFGLYEMHGNVCEWCEDILKEDHPSFEPRYILRGGAWNDRIRNCRSASRSGYAESFRSYALGVRVSRKY